MTSRQILVAGATGYLGRPVVQTLKRDSWYGWD